MGLLCKHNWKRTRWHWTHYPNGNEPLSLEVEYVCLACGKRKFTHHYGQMARLFAKILERGDS